MESTRQPAPIVYDHLSIEEATALQLELAKQLIFEPIETPKTIAGADISFNKDSSTVYAGIVILNYPGLVLKSYALATFETTFPYVPGFLGFREIPALLKAWEMITDKPDVVVLDGNGILHPRRMGVASHFGIIANQPTIGCAKSLLYGKNHEPAAAKFSTAEMTSRGETLGYALRTKEKCKPVYISAGYKVTQEKSLDIIKSCTGRYRIPEPTRVAHEIVNQFRLGQLKTGFHQAEQALTLF